GAVWRRNYTSLFVDGCLLSSQNLLFGLEPVFEFRAGLIALEDVQFVSSSPDSLFKRQRLDRRFFRACGFWHGDYLRRLRYHSFLSERNGREDREIRGMRTRILAADGPDYSENRGPEPGASGLSGSP